MSSLLGYPYGDTVLFRFGTIGLTIAETQFHPTQSREDGDLAMCGSCYKVQDGKKIDFDISTFAQGYMSGPEFGEFYDFEFNLINLTDEDKTKLWSIRQLSYGSKKTPVYMEYRRIAFESPAALRRRAKRSPDPVNPHIQPGMISYYPITNVFLSFEWNDFKLMKKSCTAVDKLWMIKFMAKEYSFIDPSQDV